MLDPTPALADELAARLAAQHREHVEQLQGEIARLTRERDEARAFAVIVIRDTMACLDDDNPGAARAVLMVGADAFNPLPTLTTEEGR